MRALIWGCSFLIAASLLMPSGPLVSAASARQICERVTYEQSLLTGLHLTLKQEILGRLLLYVNTTLVKS
ncbi:hypothetical protein ACO0LM_05605 [Undibacterium sp. Di26W]|uniref:hypothetical protein n=1 Tax=Undibacterium sp. Di26W TaxID=3413035 RepID=UPI003BF15048